MRVHYVGLSVRDARRSARWYRELFGMETVRENFAGSNWESDWDEVPLRHPVPGQRIGPGAGPRQRHRVGRGLVVLDPHERYCSFVDLHANRPQEYRWGHWAPV
jgi:catechol 2,3-dioxygenase-like lactoylglutathione lyase family enzyme